jgi:phosphosulfolactate synthase
LGLRETEDVLETAGEYVDFWKLAFGTPALYPGRLLKRKIGLLREAGVEPFPGGTFMEIAFFQGWYRDFLERARELGFAFLEISDGTVSYSLEERRSLIREARAAGFQVFTEVGKKHPADRVPTTNIKEQIESDLQEGAFRVIVEGRESGKGVVVFRGDGTVDEDELEELVRDVPDTNLLVWEAPLREQQQDLILRFGPNVNLGNIPPQEVLSVEALRRGLRGDTLRASLLGQVLKERVEPPGGAEAL